MNIPIKVKNVTSNMISNFWGTLERVNFDFTFKNGKSVNLTHEVYGKSDGVSCTQLVNRTSNQIKVDFQL